MAATKGAKIYDLSKEREKKQGAFKSRAGPAENGSAGRGMSAESCIAVLETIAPISGSLASLLAIPEKIHSVGGAAISFSSEPGNNIMPLTGFLLHKAPFPGQLPSFGIHISSMGSNAFAILYDSKRKIIVCESIDNAYSEDGSWSSFESSLSDAISTASYLSRAGQQFRFVVVKDSVSTII